MDGTALMESSSRNKTHFHKRQLLWLQMGGMSICLQCELRYTYYWLIISINTLGIMCFTKMKPADQFYNHILSKITKSNILHVKENIRFSYNMHATIHPCQLCILRGFRSIWYYQLHSRGTEDNTTCIKLAVTHKCLWFNKFIGLIMPQESFLGFFQ